MRILLLFEISDPAKIYSAPDHKLIDNKLVQRLEVQTSSAVGCNEKTNKHCLTMSL